MVARKILILAFTSGSQFFSLYPEIYLNYLSKCLVLFPNLFTDVISRTMDYCLALTWGQNTFFSCHQKYVPVFIRFSGIFLKKKAPACDVQVFILFSHPEWSITAVKFWASDLFVDTCILSRLRISWRPCMGNLRKLTGYWGKKCRKTRRNSWAFVAYTNYSWPLLLDYYSGAFSTLYMWIGILKS